MTEIEFKEIEGDEWKQFKFLQEKFKVGQVFSYSISGRWTSTIDFRVLSFQVEEVGQKKGMLCEYITDNNELKFHLFVEPQYEMLLCEIKLHKEEVV